MDDLEGIKGLSLHDDFDAILAKAREEEQKALSLKGLKPDKKRTREEVFQVLKYFAQVKRVIHERDQDADNVEREHVLFPGRTGALGRGCAAHAGKRRMPSANCSERWSMSPSSTSKR